MPWQLQQSPSAPETSYCCCCIPYAVCQQQTWEKHPKVIDPVTLQNRDDANRGRRQQMRRASIADNEENATAANNATNQRQGRGG